MHGLSKAAVTGEGEGEIGLGADQRRIGEYQSGYRTGGIPVVRLPGKSREARPFLYSPFEFWLDPVRFVIVEKARSSGNSAENDLPP